MRLAPSRKRIISVIALIRTSLLAALLATPVAAQTNPAGPRLEYVLILSRHGVRSALKSVEYLNDYASQPWHPLDSPIGYLTAHGRWGMQMTGSWDAQYLASQSLLRANDCADASHIYFRADSIQRDVESARAIALGMFPDCRVPIHAVPLDAPDPMFLSAAAPGLLDRDAAVAAILGRTGGAPDKILDAHKVEVELVQKILTGNGPAPRKALARAEAVTGDLYSKTTGPVANISSVTDALLLQYEEGYPAGETGWGRLNESNLPALLTLHQATTDELWDVPMIARARGSNLLAHILQSMQQAIAGHPVLGAVGNAGDKGLFILGHDSDLGHLATLLNLSWILESFPPKMTPPGAQMIFEVLRDRPSEKFSVRVSIVGQTIQQIHDGVAPTLATPPMRIALFIPGCSAPAEGYPCDWESFRRTLENAIDWKQVRPEPETLR